MLIKVIRHAFTEASKTKKKVTTSMFCFTILCLSLFSMYCRSAEAVCQLYDTSCIDSFSTVAKAASEKMLKQASSKLKGTMPVYLQTDSRWAGIAYAGGTIETNGCGLTCAAAVYQYLTGIETTPALLQAEVGDSCTDGHGNNNMALFIQWMQSKDSTIKSTEQLWSTNDLVEQIQQKHVVFLSVGGKLGKSWYGGHIITLFDGDDSGFSMLDPDCEQNCRRWTYDELKEVRCFYCYGVWKE